MKKPMMSRLLNCNPLCRLNVTATVSEPHPIRSQEPYLKSLIPVLILAACTGCGAGDAKLSVPKEPQSTTNQAIKTNLVQSAAIEVSTGAAEFECGLKYEHGEGFPRDLSKAFQSYFASAEKGYSRGELALAHCYFNGLGTTNNLQLGLQNLVKAANEGLAQAQFEYGNCRSRGIGAAADEEEGFKWIAKAAAQGYQPAELAEGYALIFGMGTMRDLPKAFKKFEGLASKGIHDAEFALGGCYYNGLGVEKSLDRAFDFVLKAAKSGMPDAQYIIGTFYLEGTGTIKQFPDAVEWLTKSAQGDCRAALALIGSAYSTGTKGFPNDPWKAAEPLRRAAEFGDSNSMYGYGLQYFIGEGGLPKDYVEAGKWIGLAIRTGVSGPLAETANRNLDFIAPRLSQDQKSEVRDFIANFAPKTPPGVSRAWRLF